MGETDTDKSAEDITLGYKQLLEVERGWRDLKTTLDLRPVYHRREDRIRAHILLCWLALLLIRIIETSTANTLPATDNSTLKGCRVLAATIRPIDKIRVDKTPLRKGSGQPANSRRDRQAVANGHDLFCNIPHSTKACGAAVTSRRAFWEWR